MKFSELPREIKLGKKPPFKLSSQTFQDFVQFLRKNRSDLTLLKNREKEKILIVKKMGLRDFAPNRIREEIQAVFK